MTRQLTFAMAGGGSGSFIGAAHRAAAQMDGRARLVAGAFSRDAGRSREFGATLGLDSSRVYGSWREMADAEGERAAAERLDFVTIVAPTTEHVPCATRFLERGFNVICEKPLAVTLAEALELQALCERTQRVFVLTHNYSGYAMVRHARALVRDGHLGTVRKVHVEYLQGWKSRAPVSQDAAPPPDAAVGCLADIGTHAFHLMSYVTGLHLRRLCADAVHNDAAVLLQFAENVSGTLHCSQVALGEENNLNVRVYGDLASLCWRQETPDELVVKYYDRPAETRKRGMTRLPPGHPEGYHEAFANLYCEAFKAMGAGLPADVPGIADGVEGIRFVTAALASSRSGSVWVDF